MSTEPLAYSSTPNRFRRLFVIQGMPDGSWQVIAEGSTERPLFATRDLAISYAGLWASTHAPSQLVERRLDGTVATLKEYD
jgi:hypothetical protein